MARYTGPKTRIARKFGEAIFGPDKVLSKKNYPPGQHVLPVKCCCSYWKAVWIT